MSFNTPERLIRKNNVMFPRTRVSKEQLGESQPQLAPSCDVIIWIKTSSAVGANARARYLN